jgi:cellulose synthase/poly-beta-1,6-N-acetylglucosamine synthase-like glycosyltransferase
MPSPQNIHNAMSAHDGGGNTVVPLALLAFILFFNFRYLKLLVGIYAWLTFKPRPIPEKPAYRTDDVTVVIPTVFKTPQELAKCLRTISRCLPAQIIIVTSNANVELVQTLVKLHSFRNTEVLGVAKLNKRMQMLRALKAVKTELVVFADDDVLWPDCYLDYLLACFENPKVGAAGTMQRTLKRSGNLYNMLGIFYLERRNFNNLSTIAIDGSISTLSGRTAAYRSKLLQNPNFVDYFTNKVTTDDKGLTRWTYSQGWGIDIQCDPRAVLETTQEEDSKFFHQAVRWAKGRWRGNADVIAGETYWYSPKYIWGLYVIYIGSFQTPALLFDGIQFLLLHLALGNAQPTRNFAFACLGSWIFFTKIVKLIPYFIRNPADVRFIPLSIAFSYFHLVVNFWAVWTLKDSSWGSSNLKVLEHARAKNEEVVPLLKEAVEGAEAYPEPRSVPEIQMNDHLCTTVANNAQGRAHHGWGGLFRSDRARVLGRASGLNKSVVSFVFARQKEVDVA